MAMNYNKLWKLLIDRNMMKKDLIQLAGISTNAMAKMGKGGDVSTQVLRKICIALDCKIEDIVEIIPDESQRFYDEEVKDDVLPLCEQGDTLIKKFILWMDSVKNIMQ